MFTQDQLREAFCMIAMQSLHENHEEITPASVFLRIRIITYPILHGAKPTHHLFDAMFASARIRETRNITSTVQRLLTECENPHTLII